MAGGASRRTERLLTLVFVLLDTNRGVTREKLRASIPDYRDSASDQAFERMFERDKEALRELGIPVETVQLDTVHDDEWAYTIDPRAYELPPVSFTSDERVALELAARAWRQAALENDAAAALHKIEVSDSRALPETSTTPPIEPRIGVSDAAFPELLRATFERRQVTFTYRKRGAQPEQRHLQPWGMVLRLGASYVVGHDVDRDSQRAFRVSRIEGDVALGAPDSYLIPAGTDPRLLLGDGEPEEIAGVARLKVTPGRAMTIRRMVGASPDEPIIDVPFRSQDRLEREIAGHGPDVIVLEPPALRAGVIARLRGAVT